MHSFSTNKYTDYEFSKPQFTENFKLYKKLDNSSLRYVEKNLKAGVNNTKKYHVFAPMGRFQLELIYLYFPPSSHLVYLCFCPVGLSL